MEDDDIDRSKYRNPERPTGYVKGVPEIKYIVGCEIDDVYYEISQWLHDCAEELHIEEREDYGTMSDLILTSDEECILEATVNEEAALTLPLKIKKEKIDDDDVEKRPAKLAIKDHNEASTLDSAFSLIDIEDKIAKKKKKIKIKKERRRSGSCSSSSSEKHVSSSRKRKSPPLCYKRRSPPSHKRHSISPIRKQRSNSPIPKQRSKSPAHKRRSISPIHKRRSISPIHKRRSISPIHKRRSNSPVHKRRSNSPDHKRRSNSPVHRRRSISPNHRRRSISPSHKRTSSIKRYHSPSSRDKVVDYSPSPSPERYTQVRIKQERVEEEYVTEEYIKEEPIKQEYVPVKKELEGPPEHLHGSWHCGVCNITMNSELVYNTHINGKRHRKNIKMKQAPQAAQAAFIPPTATSEDMSKYPKPAIGVIRRAVQKPAEMQGMIEKTVRTPCPGLNFVIEIQGVSQIQYYCSLCDSTCSSNSIIPHLTGFKHQLSTVKHFKPGTYEVMQGEPKWKIEKELKMVLHGIQQLHGKGRMVVEVDEINSSAVPFSHPPRDHRDIPSTSRVFTREEEDASFSDRYQKSTMPDLTVSDYFCRFCQSHMNSLQMWEAHIRGKRHLANLKKMPGDKPSKTKTVHVPGRQAHIIERIKRERPPGEPFVGLKEIRETEIKESNGYSYQCFLCGSCHTQMDIMDHLMSLKHRNKYLDHVDFNGREVLDGMSDSMASSLVRDMCRQVEAEEGMGKPEVHVDKNSLLKY